jgi:hypothetical protein
MVIGNRSPAVAASIGATLVAVFVGCSTSGRPTSASATTVAQSASTSSRPATTSPTTSAPDRPGPHGEADDLSITISAQAGTTVKPGGPAMRINVALLNTIRTDMAQVGLVVSLGHCSCGSPEQHMMPAGTMRMLDPNTNSWVTAPYNREAGGMDFILQTLVPPFGIKGHQIINYELEMQLDAKQDFTVTKGGGAINVTRTNVTTHNPIGPTPVASLRISVEP